MREDKLQSQVVIEFSQRYPQKSGQLFHVANERNHKLQAFKARGLGIVPGVADLIYFSNKRNVATELKTPGSRHVVSKVMRQVEWGELWESKGNHWRLCTNADDALSCYKGKFKGMTTGEVRKMLESVKTKTIKF